MAETARRPLALGLISATVIAVAVLASAIDTALLALAAIRPDWMTRFLA